MTDARPNLFTRDDTFFGVCQALGDDMGINADWLRVAAAGIFFLAPVPVMVGYCVLGLIIAAVRWWVPSPVAPLLVIEAPADGGTDPVPVAHASSDAQSAPVREAMPLAA